MSPKSSAHYQREYRQRLREQGLVKKEVWIRPEHAKRLSELEQTLRRATVPPETPGGQAMTENNTIWTTATLYEALKAQVPFENGHASIKLIDGVEPSVQLEMHEYGDLPIFITVFGEQIIVDAVMWPLSDVTDPAAFNDTVLRTHKYFPLSTISLDTLMDGEAYYQMFGSLSAAARIGTVVYEIETLARNVIQATEAYGEYLSERVTA